MPGRVTRGTRSSALSLKSAGRTSSPITDIPDEGDDTSLRRSICTIFAESQKSVTRHSKLCFALRKVQEQCCYEPVTLKKGKRAEEEFDEDDFNKETVRCVLRVLPVKKAEPAGDRVIRFLGTFLNAASGKDNEIADQGDPDATSLPETPTSRLTTQVLQELLPKMNAKDKNIRFRATQITSHIINSLDTLDDTLFHKLRLALLKRIHDKEAMVRLQAVYGLGRLAAEVDDDEKDDDSDSDNEVGTGVLEKLLNVLQNDPAAEVRRNLLLNLPLTKEVLPYLLERARDADASTRRALYARLLPALGDFRHLSLTHREKLLRWGLRDRDENVRNATARLFRERWIEDCAALPAAQTAEQAEGEDGQAQKAAANQAAEPSLDALLELLERIDVVNSGTEGGIALTAMQEFWAGRPDYLDYVSFPDHFWDDLNPELAFVARTFNDFCRQGNKEVHHRDLNALVEEKLPEVTKFGFFLERELNKLIEHMREAATGEDADAEEDSAQSEFVVEQLLHMALTFDYSDEVGRRKMFGLMREALAIADLPEEATRLVVEVLRMVCGEDNKGERQFCGIVLEAIAEVHDTIMGENAAGDDISSNVDESFHSATSFVDEDAIDGATGGSERARKSKKAKGTMPEDAAEAEEAYIREIMVNMKCLHIALCMLQNVGGDLEDDANLVTMLNNLVVPAVRSQEAPIRERGLLCLGLCCLLGKNLAQENLTLFLHCFAKGHPTLQVIALQIIADILITHPSLLAESSIDNTTATEQQQDANQLTKQIIKAFQKALKSDDPAVQSTGATALSKAMLSRLITNEDLLKQLVITYFDPETNSNAQLRQSLSYFLPVYCHSRAGNAKLMATVAVPVIAKLATLRDALLDDLDADDEAGDTMVKLSVVGQMLLDWTDPRKMVGFAESAAPEAAGINAAGDTHFLLAAHVLERLTGPTKAGQLEKEERKVLFSMLGKLHLPAGACEADTLAHVLTLVQEAFDAKVAGDATSRNVLTKLRDALLKLMNAVTALERGGGGAEETVVESTEVQHGAEEEEIEEEVEEDEDLTVMQRTLRDTTLGGTTMGVPDGEGTRVVLGVEDSEMMDVDGEEYTTTEL
ncbi:nuclear condensing complex subunit [Neohortaea acidophila]|uniref:Nuclear condensing complex subunit n=1 Tax=Neohortaea acidophila TaxID=245834 RepID=A0A6A6PTD5_9PEZI|nr:nuclear condensing complex subunit [Neohortaea acidophila]KAF2483369.1 nuclear condensing complex subunit [Neohortaea acidophila]